MVKIDLHFKKSHGHYVVYSDVGHTHIRSHKTCVKLISMLNRGILPESSYLKESARRLLKEHEYSKLTPKKRKQKYINIQRKVG